MGLLSKIVKGVKKIGSKIVGGIMKIGDALTGGNFSKWMSKDWVQKGLMAVSLLTGGVAIVNGVMQGFNAASAATGFASKFVTGATEFVKGVGAGLMDPVGKGKEILGAAGDAMGIGQAANAAGAGASESVAAIAESGGTALPTSSPVEAAIGGDAVAMSGGMSPAPNAAFDMFGTAGDAMTRQMSATQMANAGQSGGWLDMLKNGGNALKEGATNYIKSPMGMQTAASAVSGYAQGQMMEERWQRLEDEAARKRESWRGFSSTGPQMDIPSLQKLRDDRRQISERGDAAQAKYGY